MKKSGYCFIRSGNGGKLKGQKLHFIPSKVVLSCSALLKLIDFERIMNRMSFEKCCFLTAKTGSRAKKHCSAIGKYCFRFMRIFINTATLTLSHLNTIITP